MSKLTRTQRTALKAITGVTINSSTEVEVYIADETGDRADWDLTEAALEAVNGIIGWGGYRSGFGSWVLSSGYTTDGLDYCDTASSIHY